jgi:hypothetical protein
MMKLSAALAALVISAAVLLLSVYGAQRLAPIIVHDMHKGWFMAASNLFMVAGLILAGRKLRRAKRSEKDERLTPLVRRSSTGLRKL